jgi:hypothetical protein
MSHARSELPDLDRTTERGPNSDYYRYSTQIQKIHDMWSCCDHDARVYAWVLSRAQGAQVLPFDGCVWLVGLVHALDRLGLNYWV